MVKKGMKVRQILGGIRPKVSNVIIGENILDIPIPFMDDFIFYDT